MLPRSHKEKLLLLIDLWQSSARRRHQCWWVLSRNSNLWRTEFLVWVLCRTFRRTCNRCPNRKAVWEPDSEKNTTGMQMWKPTHIFILEPFLVAELSRFLQFLSISPSDRHLDSMFGELYCRGPTNAGTGPCRFMKSKHMCTACMQGHPRHHFNAGNKLMAFPKSFSCTHQSPAQPSLLCSCLWRRCQPARITTPYFSSKIWPVCLLLGCDSTWQASSIVYELDLASECVCRTLS